MTESENLYACAPIALKENASECSVVICVTVQWRGDGSTCDAIDIFISGLAGKNWIF